MRECEEELGIEVAPQSLEFIVEGLHGETFHRLDFVFLCTYLGKIANAQIQEDECQVGSAWLTIENLLNEPLYPVKLRPQIIRFFKQQKTTVYLGNENKE